jgi:hypothetical protein
MFHFKQRPTWRLGISALAAVLSALVVRHFAAAETAVFCAVNSFEIVDWMMQESLDLLINKLAVAAIMNTEVQKEFEHDFAPGETVRVKFPQEYLIRDGLAYTEQGINRRNTTVSCNQIFGVDFGWDSFEKAVKMERGEALLRREYLEPAVAQMAQEIESRACNFMRLNTSNVVGILGTNPATFDVASAAARERLIELGMPAGKDRAMFVPPAVMRALKASAISYFNPVTDISKQFREGIVGSGDGFDWYESVSLYQHTAGTWAAAVTVATSSNQGDTTLAVTCTTGDTFNQGDKFSIAAVNPTNPRTRRKVGPNNRQFVVLQATVGAAGAATLSISPALYGPGSQYQNVDALPLAGAALTLFPGTTSPNGLIGTVGLAAHTDAFALVGVEFENPKKGSVEISEQLKDDETGIPLAFVRAFDPIGRRWINRWDTCIGFGSLWSDNLAVAVLSS